MATFSILTEYSMEKGAWWATVHKGTKSWTTGDWLTQEV